MSENGFKKSARIYLSYYGDVLPKEKNVLILDIGCGTGQFLYFLDEQGYSNYYGIDASEEQIDFCRKNVTKKVGLADIFEYLKDKKETFDVVSANDVIEHIPKQRLVETLALIHGALRKDGVFLMKVPNMSNPFNLLNRYMDITHEIGFTEYSICEVLDGVGFSSVAIRNASYPVVSLKSLLRRISEVSVHAALKFLYLAQGNIMPKVLSTNVIAIAKK